MLLSTLAVVVLRLLFRRSSSVSKSVIAVFVITLIPEVVLFRYLANAGTIRRDPTTGALLSAGEDLSRPGVMEWCFDVIYITCEPKFPTCTTKNLTSAFLGACQVGSAAFGEWFWWLYLSVSAQNYDRRFAVGM